MSDDAKRKPAVDLDGMTIEDLAALRDRVDAKHREKQEEGRKALIAEFRDKAARLGLPFESLLPGHGSPARKRGAAGEKLPVKYRGPHGEEWSGRGRLPQWVADAEKQGRHRDEFKV